MKQKSALQQIDRRTFLGGTAATVAAAELPAAALQPRASIAASLPTALKQIRAGVLDVAYAEAGSESGEPVILLHGWPYDIHSFGAVAAILASNGFRAITPFLRGYGATRFISADTMRSGEPAATAMDRHRHACVALRRGRRRRSANQRDAGRMGLSQCTQSHGCRCAT